MKPLSWVAYFVVAVAMLVAGCAATPPPPRAATRRPEQGADHRTLRRLRQGLRRCRRTGAMRALIEYGGKRILFDTGNNRDILAQNAKAKGVDLSKLDFVVMSHRHGDHMGGMAYLLSVNPKVKIYAPKEGFGVYGADLPEHLLSQGRHPAARAALLRRQAAGSDALRRRLARRQLRADRQEHRDRARHPSDRAGLRQAGDAGTARTVACHRHARRHGDRRRLLASRHRQDRRSGSAINPRIHFVAGGFHLVVSKDPEIEKIVTAAARHVQGGYVAPGHCTGEPTFTALKKAFGDRYLYAGLGTTFALGTTPRQIVGAVQNVAIAPDEEDLRDQAAREER